MSTSYVGCPAQGRFDDATAEQLHKEILDSIKDYLRLKWPPVQQEEQQMQLSADTPRPNPHMVFAATNHRTYEEMMALARDAWQWALVAAAILEEQIERVSHSTSCQQFSSHWWSSSCKRSRSFGQQKEGSQVTPHWEGKVDINFFKHWRASWETSHQRSATQELTKSPSSSRWRCQVTFTKGRAPSLEGSLRHGVREHPHDSGTEMGYQLSPPMWQTEATPQEMAAWSRPWEEAQTIPVEGEDVHLKCHLPLEPHLSNSWVRRSPTQLVPIWEMASCHYWCPKIWNPPPTCLRLDRVAC